MSLRKAAAEKGVPVIIRTGSPGQLQVFKDGTKLFDYKEAGVLPATRDLLQLIAEASPER